MKSMEKERMFHELLDTQKDRLYRLCRGYLYAKDEVDDLFQDVLVNIWTSLESFRHEASIQTWTYRIAVNTALMYNRKTTKSAALFRKVEPQALEQRAQEADDHRSERLESLRKALARLNPQDRLIISLSLDELTYRQISEIVGITENYVGVKINRIKQQLERLIQREADE